MITEMKIRELVLLVSRDAAALQGTSPDNDGTWRLEIADSGWQALERVQCNDTPHLILLDLGVNAADGLHTLRWLRRVRPDVPIVLLSQTEDAAQKIEALRLGARDFLCKPFDGMNFRDIVAKHIDRPQNDRELGVSSDNIERVAEDMIFVSASPAMRELRTQAGLLAQIDAPILMVGRRDTGKEVAARLIHKLSVRSGFKFLKVTCSELSADLLEAELFGTEHGAQHSSGRFADYAKGTVYFDEITGLPLRLQEKLVGLLQDKSFVRPGGGSRVESDLRIIAATQSNIEEALADGSLREDLYFRLSAFTVYVPPLSERREDISVLLNQFMNQLSRHYNLPARTFSTVLVSACRSYAWPGNLKELECFVKRYLVVGDEVLALTELERKSAITDEHQSQPAKIEVANNVALGAKENGSGLKSLVESVKGEAERNAIIAALEQTRWNRKAASKVLQVSYRTLLYKIQHYHLTPPADYLTQVFAEPGIKSIGQRSVSSDPRIQNMELRK